MLDAYATGSTPSMVVARKESEAEFEAAFDEFTQEHREIVTLSARLPSGLRSGSDRHVGCAAPPRCGAEDRGRRHAADGCSACLGVAAPWRLVAGNTAASGLETEIVDVDATKHGSSRRRAIGLRQRFWRGSPAFRSANSATRGSSPGTTATNALRRDLASEKHAVVGSAGRMADSFALSCRRLPPRPILCRSAPAPGGIASSPLCIPGRCWSRSAGS